MPTTTYMGMVLPTPGVTLGPDWATQLNAALVVSDAHDHSSGKGKQVPASGLNINADLSFGSYNVTAVKSARFTSQGSPLGGATDLSCLYVSSGNLYYNNSGGTQIQLTSGGSLNVAGLSQNYWTRRAVSTNVIINAADADVYYDTDCSGGARTFTLPAANAVTPGRFYVFSDTTGSSATNAITVNRAGGDTIDGVSSATLTSNYASLMLISDGVSKWKVLRFYDPTRVNGATVPLAGTLTTGNVLQVSGAAALSYGPLNLAGGANYVSGTLPAANLPDCSTAAKGIIQLGGSLGGTVAAQTVKAIDGNAGTCAVGCANLQFSNAINTPFVGHQAKGSAGAGTNMTVFAQDANTSGSGGSLLMCGGAGAGTGQHGPVQLAVGSFGASKKIMVEGAHLSTGNRVLALCASSAVTATNMPANTGSDVVFLANTATPPSTGNPSGGIILFGDSDRFAFRTAAGKTVAVSGVTNTTASVGNTGPTVPGSCEKWLELVHDGNTYRVALFA